MIVLSLPIMSETALSPNVIVDLAGFSPGGLATLFGLVCRNAERSTLFFAARMADDANSKPAPLGQRIRDF